MADATMHADALAAEADALAAVASAQVEAALAGPLVVAAVDAVRAALAPGAPPDPGQAPTAIMEAAADLAAFVQAAMEGALLAGFLAGVRGQQAATPDTVIIQAGVDGLAPALAGIPVQGHTCARTGAYQGEAYAFGAEGVLGSATALGSALAVPPGLAEEARLAGNRAGSAVAEAFHTGAGVARQAVGVALQAAVARA